ncbi:bifunctional DNA-formamidopyrimidine glycosylase/DNA-(apurinic or apyrimidinic site) lyase [Brachybacterium sp. UMB0905]|uniref:bifunctional DNA-formamidopyrimidine glycosylase/DNA-(apurinic or apyrimidinic site) lyase n=1 Tax=Brachybacterium sp. UMB0905 TaxID=2069310 RepID=UPI000C80A063|nr:bifunctional DNA-formamidopyrimidine glycosylase/DNA-(apurinic or apyrimidinic site) lyase [Brachybacterium sp. UMB0905]PMC74363.1 DNA-formamidopyrimidine glycosylase [Brachybacterium sp. UMB0905]
MPELPEVEVVRRGLVPRTVGRTVTSLEVLDERIIRRQRGGVDRLRAAVEGRRLAAVVRRGKFLWWRLQEADGAETGEALMGHLGMSGQLRITTAAHDAAQELRHRRLSMHLDDGARIDLVDQRLFGGLWATDLAPTADGRPAAADSPDDLLPVDLAHVARDLLDPAADLPAIARELRRRRAGIKSLLLAQEIVSGIGNIYADEALWSARIRHDTPGAALTQRRALNILRAAAEVMERALAVGGTSFDALYVNVDGRSGYFARSLSAYGREGQPCLRCGRLLRRVFHQGRSSHFCPRCQPRRALSPANFRKDAS